jgi:hypothetical protein
LSRVSVVISLVALTAWVKVVRLRRSAVLLEATGRTGEVAQQVEVVVRVVELRLTALTLLIRSV